MSWLMEKTLFNKPIKIIKEHMTTFDKIVTGQGDDYTTGCLLDYPYFKEYYKNYSSRYK